jgi:hypothetical protein
MIADSSSTPQLRIMAAKEPTFDPFDRGNFYGSPPPPPPASEVSNEDDDYEVEAPDEQLLQGERTRAEEEIVLAQSNIDIDAIYRETEADPDWEEMWKGLRFQYQTKHLLILMAVVAMLVMAVLKTNFAVVLIVVTVLGLAGVHGYLAWRENQRQERLETQRKEMYERARKVREKAMAAKSPSKDG